MRKEKGLTYYGVALTVAMGIFSVLASLPAGAAEECQRNGHAVSEDALCCNVKRVQRCAGAHGWADYPTEVCDRGESAVESSGTEPRASSAPPTASAPAAGRPASGCFDCDGTVHGTGQTAQNAGHAQVCQNNGKWKTVDVLKK
jgi:hypothetical protein